MKRFATAAVVLLLLYSSAIAQDGAKTESGEHKKEKEALAGLWYATVLVENGVGKGPSMLEEEDDVFLFIFLDDKVIERDGRRWGEWSYRLRPTENPKQIDLEVKSPPITVTRKGIYKLDDDKLTVHLGGVNETRPTDFVPKKDDDKATWIEFKKEERLWESLASSIARDELDRRNPDWAQTTVDTKWIDDSWHVTFARNDEGEAEGEATVIVSGKGKITGCRDGR